MARAINPEFKFFDGSRLEKLDIHFAPEDLTKMPIFYMAELWSDDWPLVPDPRPNAKSTWTVKDMSRIDVEHVKYLAQKDLDEGVQYRVMDCEYLLAHPEWALRISTYNGDWDKLRAAGALFNELHATYKSVNSVTKLGSYLIPSTANDVIDGKQTLKEYLETLDVIDYTVLDFLCPSMYYNLRSDHPDKWYEEMKIYEKVKTKYKMPVYVYWSPNLMEGEPLQACTVRFLLDKMVKSTIDGCVLWVARQEGYMGTQDRGWTMDADPTGQVDIHFPYTHSYVSREDRTIKPLNLDTILQYKIWSESTGWASNFPYGRYAGRDANFVNEMQDTIAKVSKKRNSILHKLYRAVTSII
jgi:hypothetical protein